MFYFLFFLQISTNIFDILKQLQKKATNFVNKAVYSVNPSLQVKRLKLFQKKKSTNITGKEKTENRKIQKKRQKRDRTNNINL